MVLISDYKKAPADAGAFFVHKIHDIISTKPFS